MKPSDFNLYNIQNFIEGNYLAFKDKLTDKGIEQFIKEQALWRAMQCSDCLTEGKCSGCPCSIPNLFFAPKKSDAEKRWGPMLPKEEWENYKMLHNIRIPKTLKFETIIRASQLKNAEFKFFDPLDFLMGGNLTYFMMDYNFLVKLDRLFSICTSLEVKNLKICLSYCTPDYNRYIGPSHDLGLHYRGKAIHLMFDGSAESRAILIEESLKLGMSVGLTDTYLHIEDSSSPAKVFFDYV